ncbi:MAG: hypothetical protein Q9164_007006 [Protoblastenia rupestris]
MTCFRGLFLQRLVRASTHLSGHSVSTFRIICAFAHTSDAIHHVPPHKQNPANHLPLPPPHLHFHPPVPQHTPPLRIERIRSHEILLTSHPFGGLDDDVRKKAIDEHKNDQLDKQKEGKGHWKRELSSNSESAIKADREEITNAEDDIAKLQKQTSGTMEEDHEQGKK